jgi:hypothetical protein
MKTSKGIEIGKFYEPKPKPMARSNSTKYVLAPHLAKPKPMARTVTRFMMLRRSFWFAWDAWKTHRALWGASHKTPGESSCLPVLLFSLAVVAALFVWHLIARA